VAAVPWVAPVYRAMPQVAEVLALPFARGGVQSGRAVGRTPPPCAGQFAKAYVCPNSLKSALIPFSADTPERIGYTGELRFGLPNAAPAQSARRQPSARRSAFDSAPESGEAGVDADRPALQVAADAIAGVLAPRGLQAQGFYVVAPGAEYGPAKRLACHPLCSLGHPAGQACPAARLRQGRCGVQRDRGGGGRYPPWIIAEI